MNNLTPYNGFLRTNKALPIQALKSIYFAYIHFDLKYGKIFWGNSKYAKTFQVT